MDLTNQFVPVILALCVTAILGIVAFVVYSMRKGVDNKASYETQLEHLLEEEYVSGYEIEDPTLVDRWNAHWGKIAKDSGIGNYHERENTAGRDVLVVGILLGIVLGIVLQSFIAGIILTLVGIFMMSSILRTLSNRKEDLLNNQLPGFLFALKSNISANETVEKAMIKVVDSMPSPLYEDLYIVKARLQANSTFHDALQELKDKTTSRDLEFLCACMMQAIMNGENIEEQITTIQRVLEERQRVSEEITRSLRSVSPATIIASIAIPGSFLASYFMDANAREFWFVDPISWIAFVAVLVLWIVGIWMSRKIANDIKNL